METSKRRIIIHVHIFKNGGTTFDYALKRNFGEGFVDHRDDSDMRQGKMEYLLKYLRDNLEVQALSSHSIVFPIISQDEFEFYPVYFLRHPIERVKSVYTFESMQSPEASLGAKMANTLDYLGYIAWRLDEVAPPSIRNIQTIFLSGMMVRPKHLNLQFEKAKENLQGDAIIGIVDRYDESMVIIEEALKKVFPLIDLSYIRQNVTETKGHHSIEEKVNNMVSSLPDEMAQKLLDANQMDIELYKIGNAKMDRLSSEIENFQEKLSKFKQRCHLLIQASV